jgi:hypothetical protein
MGALRDVKQCGLRPISTDLLFVLQNGLPEERIVESVEINQRRPIEKSSGVGKSSGGANCHVTVNARR